jgi:addiction module HigA family antidote
VETRAMSGLRTIIKDEDRLDNVHPGDILREDFLIGSEIPIDEVADGSGIDVEALRAILASKRDIDAAADARLTRYFGMSEGYFLRLQNRFDIEEVRRKEGAELDRIVPRAA